MPARHRSQLQRHPIRISAFSAPAAAILQEPPPQIT
eukprot:COSAG01_NODE_11169_length_1991_cov_1.653805_2_plen_35_part_01